MSKIYVGEYLANAGSIESFFSASRETDEAFFFPLLPLAGNLSWNTTDEILMQTFTQYGPVLDVRGISLDSGRSHGQVALSRSIVLDSDYSTFRYHIWCTPLALSLVLRLATWSSSSLYDSSLSRMLVASSHLSLRLAWAFFWELAFRLWHARVLGIENFRDAFFCKLDVASCCCLSLHATCNCGDGYFGTGLDVNVCYGSL
jgi:hypothetical protein